MKSLMKIFVVTAPVLAIVFWYVISQQHTQQVEMTRDDAVFDQEWNRFEAQFTGSHEERAAAYARIQKAEKRQTAAENELHQATKDIAEYREAFKEAMNEEGAKKAKPQNECGVCHKRG